MKSKAMRLDNGEWVEGYYVKIEHFDGYIEHLIYTGKMRSNLDTPERFDIVIETLEKIKLDISDLKPINTIRVWRWEDAPKEFKVFSTNGGDEDWVALIPPKLSEYDIAWAIEGSNFGCCSVNDYSYSKLPGYIIRIGAHA